MTKNSGVEDSKLLMTSQYETWNGLHLIKEPVNSYEKVQCRKANWRNIYCEAILWNWLCQEKPGVTGRITLILMDEFQIQL